MVMAQVEEAVDRATASSSDVLEENSSDLLSGMHKRIPRKKPTTYDVKLAVDVVRSCGLVDEDFTLIGTGFEQNGSIRLSFINGISITSGAGLVLTKRED